MFTLDIFFNDLQKEKIENVCQFEFDNDFLSVWVETDELNAFGQPLIVKRLNYSRLDIMSIRCYEKGGILKRK